MPSALPLSITRGPPRKADILLDTTCFSSAELDNLSDFDTDSDTDTDSDIDSHHPFFDLANPTSMNKKEIQDAETNAEVLRRKALCNGALDTQARYNHPTFPPSTFLTTFMQPTRFKDYITNEFPSITLSNQTIQTTTTNQEALRKEVNATMANSLLNSIIPTNIATLDWIRYNVFPDELLPVPFNDKCLDNVKECWDLSSQKFSNFPEATVEKGVQDWLNHLAHTLGVKHDLIQKKQPEEVMSEGEDSEEVDSGGNHGGAEIGDGAYVGVEDVENIEDIEDIEDMEEDTLDSGVEEEGGFVVSNAQDRSFSMVSYKRGPSGGYRLRKPDLILVNRNLRHFLNAQTLRPRWHHVEAILEVSVSAPRESMITQIVEKTSLMFEAQPFRRFAIGLALRGASVKKLEFCFLLVDRSGICSVGWKPCTGYDGICLARIVFALSYAKPELLGVDTSMTVDPLSGNVIKIKVQDQEFQVIKHIHSSLVLFGRGTHIFLVRTQDGRFHILKDAWLLVDHGISEIAVLSEINNILKQDSSEDAKAYRTMHPRFIVGEEIGDSTKARRGRLTNTPPDRVHRRVVTGPIGDPLTSFRSREEFVQVLLDCVKCKSGVQY
jgi:protein kinase-like protein